MVVAVAYFNVDCAPGRYFKCEKQRCTLSETSCAKQYVKAKGGSSLCSGCEVGASHAGEKIVYGLPVKMCCRCGGTDKRLIHARICVSCYNREREYVLGRNAKGKPPIHARALHAVGVFVAKVGRIQIGVVADTAEAAMAPIRKSHEATISFMPPGVPDYIFAQMRLL